MVSPICIHCRGHLPADGSACKRKFVCRQAGMRARVGQAKNVAFLKNVEVARSCIARNVPPNEHLFRSMISTLDPDPKIMGHALAIKPDIVLRWKEGKSQPKPLDSLRVLSYIIQALEDRAIIAKESNHES